MSYKKIGVPTTIGELKSIVEKYSDDTPFGFRNQPRQELLEVKIKDDKPAVCFNESEEFPSLETLFANFIEFALLTFKQADQFTSLKKLEEEVKELESGLRYPERIGKNVLALEYVDCIMCLLQSAAKAGISTIGIRNAFEYKLNINKNRKWVKNNNNTYSHVSDAFELKK